MSVIAFASGFDPETNYDPKIYEINPDRYRGKRVLCQTGWLVDQRGIVISAVRSFSADDLMGLQEVLRKSKQEMFFVAGKHSELDNNRILMEGMTIGPAQIALRCRYIITPEAYFLVNDSDEFHKRSYRAWRPVFIYGLSFDVIGRAIAREKIEAVFKKERK